MPFENNWTYHYQTLMAKLSCLCNQLRKNSGHGIMITLCPTLLYIAKRARMGNYLFHPVVSVAYRVKSRTLSNSSQLLLLEKLAMQISIKITNQAHWSQLVNSLIQIAVMIHWILVHKGAFSLVFVHLIAIYRRVFRTWGFKVKLKMILDK